MAQTSVTLYGLLDMGLTYQRGKAGANDVNRPSIGSGYQSKLGVSDGTQSGSRWGMRGVENLGDGLSAIFTLESGFAANDGQAAQSGRLFGRQATVGLQGGFGKFEFGRQTNIASNYLTDADPFALDFVQANMGTTFSSANTVRYDNLVLYQTPVWNG